MKFRERWASLIMAGLLAPGVLFAQDDEVSAFYWADTVTIEGVKHLQIPTVNAIATKMVLPLHSTPASVGVVTRPMFDRQHGSVLSDALKNISGVNVQHGTGTHDFFLIRGFESLSGGLVLTDGAAEPEVSFYHLYNINRVEVLKGPAAFLYGGNPLSGAVNLSRKQPVFSNFARLTGSYGDFNTFSGMIDVGGSNKTETLAFRLNSMWQDSENYRDEKDRSTYAVNPAFTWKISDESSVTLNFEYIRSNAEPDAGLPLYMTPDTRFIPRPSGLPAVDRTRSYQTGIDDSKQDLFRLRLDYRRQLTNRVQLRSKFYYTQLDWVSTGTLLNGAFQDQFRPDAFNVFRTVNALDDAQKFVGNQLEALTSFNTGELKHNLLVGFEVSRRTDNFNLDLAAFSPPSELNPAGTNTGLVIDLNDPRESVTEEGQLQFVDFATGDAKSLLLAPYFVNQTELSQAIKVFVGGRLDIINHDDDRTDFDLAIFQAIPSQNERNYRKFSPMLGLTISPFSNLSLYANAGQSFRPPSTLVIGDPKPEESRQIELGAKFSGLNGKLSTTIAVFNLERDNIGIPTDETVASQKLGDQRSRGVELEVAAQPAADVTAFVNYSFTDAELTTFNGEVRDLLGTTIVESYAGNTPAFAPRHILNVWATKDLSKKLGFGAGVRYVGKQYANADNFFAIDEYITVDASLFYTFRNFRWSVNVKNLGDKKYLRRGGFGSSSVTPGNPRAVYGRMSFYL